MPMSASAADGDELVLPAPAPVFDCPLGQAFWRRRSTRDFRPDALGQDALSTLLWCAFGVNRPASRGRTAPSAHDWQEIDIYVVLAGGSYRYDAVPHCLRRVAHGDLRALTGEQAFPATAPLNLVYVADFARMETADLREREFLAGAAAGCIAQNVYLACAAGGWGTVVRARIDRHRLATALHLAKTQRITLAQTVGLPTPAGHVTEHP